MAGDKRQFTATCTYADNTTGDCTSNVSWNSSNTTIASISAAGLLTAASAGTTTITAKRTQSNVTSTGVTVTVQAVQSPVTTDNWTDNWTSAQTVTITLTATDNSGTGIQWTKYCVDTANTCDPTTGTTGTSVSVTCASGSVCTQYIRYASQDNRGTTETTKSETVRQDLQAPTTTDNWTDTITTAQTITVALAPSDVSGSGILWTKYCVDTANSCDLTTGTTYTIGTPVTVTCAADSSCTQYVRYYSKDNANNSETVNSKRVRQNPPAVPATCTTDCFGIQNNASGAPGSTINIPIHVTNTGSKISSIKATITIANTTISNFPNTTSGSNTATDNLSTITGYDWTLKSFIITSAGSANMSIGNTTTDQLQSGASGDIINLKITIPSGAVVGSSTTITITNAKRNYINGPADDISFTGVLSPITVTVTAQ